MKKKNGAVLHVWYSDKRMIEKPSYYFSLYLNDMMIYEWTFKTFENIFPIPKKE